MSSLRRLERILSYDYLRAQRDAIEELGYAEDPMATEVLLSRFNSLDSSLREAVVEALGHRKDPRALDLLEEVVQRASLILALDAIFAIGRIGGERAWSFLYQLFHSTPNPLYRAAILSVMKEVDNPRTVELSLLCLEEDSPASSVASSILHD